jgi:hypothetical protein
VLSATAALVGRLLALRVNLSLATLQERFAGWAGGPARDDQASIRDRSPER